MTEPNFTCSICGVGFETARELEQHTVHEHTPAEQARAEETIEFVCQLCGSTFPTQARLDLHMAQHHPDKAAPVG
jgi:hypothetical protein